MTEMKRLAQFPIGARRGMLRATPARTWFARGRACEERCDVAGAKLSYQRAVAGGPDLAAAWCNLGRLHHEAGDLADAEACYRLAICAAPETSLYWFDLGVAVEDRGGTAEAIACYERALELDAGMVDAHENLARLCEQIGQAEDDVGSLRRAIRHLAAARRR